MKTLQQGFKEMTDAETLLAQRDAEIKKMEAAAADAFLANNNFTAQFEADGFNTITCAMSNGKLSRHDNQNYC